MNIYSTKDQLRFYVYFWVRSKSTETGDIGTVYYVGKGSGKRAWRRGGPENKKYVIIAESNLTEIGAFALERRMVRWYGRIDNDTGILRNMTDGGPGGAGVIETKARNDARRVPNPKKGNPGEQNGMFGIRLTGEQNGMYNRKHKSESRELMKKNRKDTRGPNNPMFGKKRSESSKKYGADHHMFGKKWSADDLAKIKKGIESSKLPCQHCNRVFDLGNYTRWHGNKCKQAH